DGVQQTEGARREQILLLPPPHRAPHQRRGVPLREVHAVALRAEPALEQQDLRGLARSVDALDGDQAARIRVRAREERARPRARRLLTGTRFARTRSRTGRSTSRDSKSTRRSAAHSSKSPSRPPVSMSITRRAGET